MDFSHFNESGRARMVNVSDKKETHRTAIAAGRVLVNRETLELIRTGGMKKGDVLGYGADWRDHGAQKGHRPISSPCAIPIMICPAWTSSLPAQRRGLPPWKSTATTTLHRRHRRGDGGADRGIRGGADGV